MTVLTNQEQQNLIDEVSSTYQKFLDPNFDASCFLTCRDNFAFTKHIESVKIFEMDCVPANPTFSITIPTYDRLETLRESIRSAIHQDTQESYEIIVIENVDDFSATTPAQEMLESEFRGKITYYKNKENLGMFGNWNRCLSLAKGEWVCILHSDDRILPNYLSEMRKAIELALDYTLIGNLDSLDNTGSSIKTRFIHFLRKFSKTKTKLFDNCKMQGRLVQLPPNAILHNKQKCIALGGYNQDEYPNGDTFFHTRALRHSKIAIYQKKLQIKTSEISEALSPRAALHCFYISPVFVYTMHKDLKPSFYAKLLRYKTLQYCQKFLVNYPLLYTHTQRIIKEYKFSTPPPQTYFKNLYSLLFVKRFLSRS